MGTVRVRISLSTPYLNPRFAPGIIYFLAIFDSIKRAKNSPRQSYVPFSLYPALLLLIGHIPTFCFSGYAVLHQLVGHFAFHPVAHCKKVVKEMCYCYFKSEHSV